MNQCLGRTHYMVTWDPNDLCFDYKRFPVFEGPTPQNQMPNMGFNRYNNEKFFIDTWFSCKPLPLKVTRFFCWFFFSSFQFLPNLRYLEVRNTTGRNIFLFLRDELQDDEAGNDDLGDSAVLESETSGFFLLLELRIGESSNGRSSFRKM